MSTNAATHYFAYSTVLDPETREEWLRERGQGGDWPLGKGKAGAAREVDLVFNGPSARWGGRVVGLVKKPGALVHGVLFTPDPGDWPAIRLAEEVKGCKQEEWTVQVEVDGKAVQAVAFSPAREVLSLKGIVSEPYARALAIAAGKAGLPGPYVARLQSESLILERVQRLGADTEIE